MLLNTTMTFMNTKPLRHLSGTGTKMYSLHTLVKCTVKVLTLWYLRGAPRFFKEYHSETTLDISKFPKEENIVTLCLNLQCVISSLKG